MHYFDYDCGISVSVNLYAPRDNSGAYYRLVQTDIDTGRVIQVRRYAYNTAGYRAAEKYAKSCLSPAYEIATL